MLGRALSIQPLYGALLHGDASLGVEGFGQIAFSEKGQKGISLTRWSAITCPDLIGGRVSARFRGNLIGKRSPSPWLKPLSD